MYIELENGMTVLIGLHMRREYSVERREKGRCEGCSDTSICVVVT